MRTPFIASPWSRIVYTPHNHLQDFCLFRDGTGLWHAYGIKGTGSWASEQSFVHAVGRRLFEPFDLLPDLLAAPPEAPTGADTEPQRYLTGGEGPAVLGQSPGTANRAPQKHAPYVVERSGAYYMFYRRPYGTMMVARSPSPSTWDGLGVPLFERRDARDACVRFFGGVYHLYYCASEIVEDVPRSCVLLRTSSDLVHWDAQRVVHVDLTRPANHSYVESPQVIEGPDGFYLFVTNVLLREAYGNLWTTAVYYSPAPDRFPDGPDARIGAFPDVLACEVERDDHGLVIARVSGRNDADSARDGFIDTARLEFC